MASAASKQSMLRQLENWLAGNISEFSFNKVKNREEIFMEIDFETADNHTRLPLLGEDAPEFKADSTQGEIDFPKDFKGKWVVLFSHPADFTPVCTSEIATFAALQDEFTQLNTALVGLSVDSNSSHLAWLQTIQNKIKFGAYKGQNINFPVIADCKMTVAKKYGMIQPSSSDSKAVRAVFIIDPKGIVRTILYYPLSTGRNFQEIKRIIQALQVTDRYGVSTPADWQPGEPVLVGAPSDMEGLRARQNKDNGNLSCQDWFFCSHSAPEA